MSPSSPPPASGARDVAPAVERAGLPPGLTLAPEPALEGLFTLVARLEGLDGYAGALTVARADEARLAPEARHHLARLELLAGGPAEAVLYVLNVFVHPSLRGRGLGVALYREAIERAWSEHRAALVAAALVAAPDRTSAAARGVWQSRGLAEVARVSGLTARARPPRGSRGPRPLAGRARVE